jgi:hypothetical protein
VRRRVEAREGRMLVLFLSLTLKGARCLGFMWRMKSSFRGIVKESPSRLRLGAPQGRPICSSLRPQMASLDLRLNARPDCLIKCIRNILR